MIDFVLMFFKNLQLWAYEVLGMYLPEVTGPNQHLMPQASRYCLPNKLKKHKDAKLNAFLAFLDGMTGALVSKKCFIEFDRH